MLSNHYYPQKQAAIMSNTDKVGPRQRLSMLLGVVSAFVPLFLSAQTLPQTVATIKPSIVAVGTFMASRNPRATVLGTGFAVGKGDTIVTNAHVIPAEMDAAHQEKLAVFYHKHGEELQAEAKVLTIDPVHDLAVLKLSGESLPPLKLGDSASVQEGEIYAFTGFPIGMALGLFPATHRGLISAIVPNAIPMLAASQLNSKLIHQLEKPFFVFQMDATAYPGSSGSPLYHAETGDVIGIINKVFVQESKEQALSKPSGITYAIPINFLKPLLP